MSRVPIAVLAAGRATRFGGGKLEALFEGRPILEWSLAAAIGCPALAHAVVAGPDPWPSALVPEGFTVLANPDPAQGLASSLAVAVDWARRLEADALVVGLGDQPLVSSEAWRLVQDAATTGVAVATYDGVRANPVKIAAHVFDLLPRTGEAGARAIFDRVMLVEVPCPGDPFDIDTKADLVRLEHRERRGNGDRQ